MRPDTLRIAVLRGALESAVGSLHRRKASDIPADDLEDFVRLDWLEWHGGGLRLTTTGNAICRKNLEEPAVATLLVVAP